MPAAQTTAVGALDDAHGVLFAMEEEGGWGTPAAGGPPCGEQLLLLELLGMNGWSRTVSSGFTHLSLLRRRPQPAQHHPVDLGCLQAPSAEIPVTRIGLFLREKTHFAMT